MKGPKKKRIDKRIAKRILIENEVCYSHHHVIHRIIFPFKVIKQFKYFEIY